MEKGIKEYLMKKSKILENVVENHGLSLNYAKICYCAMSILREQTDETKEWPFHIKALYDKMGIDVKRQNLNEFMESGDVKKLNSIIGKISIRPDYNDSSQRKTTVYIEKDLPLSLENYALAHELCHLILSQTEKNRKERFYTDDYCTMPMLPKQSEEMIADAFAIFLLIPFDEFLKTFKEYIRYAKRTGSVPIRTEEWIEYLSAVSVVPYYYVACGYQQIRHLAYLIYHLYIADEAEKARYETDYGKEVFELYEIK